MNLITYPGTPLHGEISLPGDKSLSHRAALFAALADGESRIENFLVSGVTQAMLEALTVLGVKWVLEGKTLVIDGCGVRGFHNPVASLDCGNSATTTRLLAGALAASGISAVIDGSPGLRRRPMDRIVEPMQKMGVNIQSTGGKVPLVLHPSTFPLHALNYTLPVASAQIKTCLLLAALAADGPTILRESAFSRDHTERMLRSMGVKVTTEKVNDNGCAQYQTILTPPKPLSLSPLSISLPGDFSSAAFLIIAALITPDSSITIRQVGLNPGRTGLLDALLAMGADIHITKQSDHNGEPVGDLTVRHSKLQATHITGDLVVRMIDEFPVFAVASAYATGTTMVSDASELRHKESDRISALCQELSVLGVQATETPDGFTIQGGKIPVGGKIQPHGDHRLAMSMAVAGLAAREPVTIQDADITAESFPEFIPTLQELGAKLATAS